MEIKNFYNKRKDLKLVAHRLGFKMTNYPENSLSVLEEIFKDENMLNACYGFEFDIRFTKDHIPVVTHDKFIDDISETKGLIKHYTYDELIKLDFGFRKSLELSKESTFKLLTLEEILNFFDNNKKSLKNRIIKIETKDPKMSKKSIKELANIINKYPSLSNNIIHLSFYPFNIISLRKFQIANSYNITKSDLLCDYKVMALLSRYSKYIDNISLRIRTNDFPKINKNNSRRVNVKILMDSFFMRFSDALNEKILKYEINKHGTVGIYVLNNKRELEKLCNSVSEQFFNDNYDSIIITTDNPLMLKTKE